MNVKIKSEIKFWCGLNKLVTNNLPSLDPPESDKIHKFINKQC